MVFYCRASIVLQGFGLKQGSKAGTFNMLSLGSVMGRTAIFVDARYLIAVTLKKKNTRVDLVKLPKTLAKDSWEKTIFYDALSKFGTKRYSNAQKFHSRISRLAKFEVRLGRLQYDERGRPTQKGVDMKLGIDLVQMSMKKDFDTAILITGDSDFLYAVEKAQEADVKVKLAYFPGSSINREFHQSFDGYELLHDALLYACKL